MVELYREGKTVVLGGKPVPLPPYTAHLIRIGFVLNPGLCGKNGIFL